MSMMDFIVWDAVVPTMQANTRDEAIRELIQSLHQQGQFPNTDVEDIVRAVLRREQLGSTGIGRSIAIPHSRHASVTKLIGTIGIAPAGIPFDSIDGEPVHVLVILISPQDRPGDHLRALENVVQTMRDDAVVTALKQATSLATIRSIITDNRPSAG
jgi:PTS system fructose-specific IIA component/PTS system nitrogen regulatory IIA component